MCWGSSHASKKNRHVPSRSRSGGRYTGTTQHSRDDYANRRDYKRYDPDYHRGRTDHLLDQNNPETTNLPRDRDTRGTRRLPYADDQGTPPPRRIRPSSGSRTQHRRGDREFRHQSNDQKPRSHRRSDGQESRSHRRRGDHHDRRSSIYGTSALPRTVPTGHPSTCLHNDLPERPLRPTGPRPTKYRSSAQRRPEAVYFVPSQGEPRAPPALSTQTHTPWSAFDTQAGGCHEASPLWGNTARSTMPEDELDVPEPTEPVFVSPTSTAAGRAAEGTERPFSADSEYTVPECEIEMLDKTHWERFSEAKRIRMRKTAQFDILGTYVHYPFVKTHLSELNSTQRDDLVRAKFGSEKGVALRMSADVAYTLRKCEIFLKEIADGDYRAGKYMSRHLSLRGQKEAFQMSERTGKPFYDIAKQFREEKSRSSISAIETGPDYMASIYRATQEPEATRALRHKYGVKHLSKNIANWPNQ